jgi:hypothetical protein
MRFMLAVSALLATALLSGQALAGGTCDECRNRDRPNIRQQVKERFSRAAPAMEVPDRRFGRERPAIVSKTDPREKIVDPHQAGRPMVPTMSSDKPLPTTPQAAKQGKNPANDMVKAHLAKKGRAVGGKADVDSPFGAVPKAMTSGIKLKVLQLQKPVNARLQVSPKAPCGQDGQCINGSTNDPTPKVNAKEDRPAPTFVEKGNDVKNTVNKRQLSQSRVQNPLKNARHGDLRSDQPSDPGAARTSEPRTEGSGKTRPDER